MITSFQDLIDARPPWSTILILYLRCIALVLLGGGVIYWARIIGIVEWHGNFFWDMPVALQGATVFFAVCLMAAVMNLVDRAPAVGPLHGPAATASDR